MEKTQKKHIRAAIYTRVSTEDQAREGYSLSIQKDYLVDFAKREKFEIHFADNKSKIYEDDGYSGYSLDRPAINQLLRDARARKFDLILVYKLDRFSRRLRDILNILDELDTLGVQFKSATEPYDTTTSSGKLMLQQLGSFAEFERNRIIERVVPGMVRGVQAGHWQGARYSPFGYRYDKTAKRLIVEESEAKLVHEIFKRYTAGESTQEIGGDFYQRKILSRSGGEFNSSLVRKIIRNKIYIGKLVWNEHHYDKTQKTLRGCRYIKNDPSKIIEANGLHEALISETVFCRAQSIMDRNRKGKFYKRHKRDYPISGILTCAKCGSSYHGIYNVSNHMTGEKRAYYRCSGRASKNIHCGNSDLRAEIPEAHIFGILESLFSSPQIQKQRLKNLIADRYQEEVTSETSRELEGLKKELQECSNKLAKLTDVYLGGTIPKEIFEQKAQNLRNEEGEIRIKIERKELQLIEKEESNDYLKRAEEVAKSAESIKENLHPSLRKELLKLIFKKVVIENQKVSKVVLFHPFDKLQPKVPVHKTSSSESEEGRIKNCQILERKQPKKTLKSWSYVLRPSDAK
ncbi:MAG: recombinase family protein [Candidatus Omnitrophica bacterium]|nr:recombinase family protein [Candidatus Omnitrophota bacterium]